jgi:glycosyltransferase involved in cell wall biosynthesis
VRRLRLLHAIHDFPPRHRAGSEIYVDGLCRELARRHDVFVVAAEYDPSVRHGIIRWREHEGLAVIEIVNNWHAERFEDTYLSPVIMRQLEHVLDATRPDVLHLHNLLNLSFDLPRRARVRGIPSVATLHDYTLVCASGGQRVHVADAHVCTDIDVERCSRCFAESPLRAQMTAARLTAGLAGRVLSRAAVAGRRVFPVLTDGAARRLPGRTATADQLSARLARARHLFEEVDRFVSPSAALAQEFVTLGLDPRRIEVSDYGFPPADRLPRRPRAAPVRIGFVGTIAWHKGAHVLIEAARLLRGRFAISIAGDPGVAPEYFARLRRSAADLPVQFHGRFGREDAAEVYGNLDVLVVPSLWPENSPLVIHEAFLHGVAVVGSRMGGIPELVVEGVNGFTYDACSPNDLAATLQRFVDDPPLACRMAAGAPAVKSIDADAAEWEERYEATLLGAGG